ncbi:unnamed protein product [Rhizoctonia solani]|uniref:Zn(2)-C6 fungal-type domain-containing protein n=1 Tax=Rhizoctonia solani TaxID=456999 RepID=A0A8H3DLS9_9AGAM|nr:unnamed protein product [Rhizoctonia solani]
MLGAVPKRSLGGCLTCKRRKKKCDERKPRCRRCELGDFHCLGYNLPSTIHTGRSPITGESAHWDPYELVMQLGAGTSTSSLATLGAFVPLTKYENEVGYSSASRILFQEVRDCLSNIPKEVLLDPVVLEDATSLIMLQYTKFSQQTLFQLPSGSIKNGLIWRIENSQITWWSMYLTARVIKDYWSGNDGQKYMGWVFRFYQQILGVPPLARLETGSEGRLGGLYDASNIIIWRLTLVTNQFYTQLIYLASMVFGTATGYSLFKRCVPVFLQLVALRPHIWSNDFAISIPRAIQIPRYEFTGFVVDDIIASVCLGTPPLLHYSLTLAWTDEAPTHYQLMYGFPVGILLLFARVNAWKVSRLKGGVDRSQDDWSSDLEKHLNDWSPILDHAGDSNYHIARFAVQEAWRQAAMIYLYMGVKEVNSADPRIATAVQQIVQLEEISIPDSPLELHLVIPCLIAGVAARKEKHRASLRNKLNSETVQKLNTFILRSSDFVTVLDHLWHGTGSGGRPITWEDYVQSRRTVLPVAG